MRHSSDFCAKKPHNGHRRRRARSCSKRGLEMSLLAFPPNSIIDSRSKQDNNSHSRKWLEKLTETAVEKAFKLQLESRRLVDIVDTHSCGDTGGLGCTLSPISSKVSRNLSISSSLASRKWVLPKNSKDRRRIATKIYTLLLQWKSDFSYEWRARVAAAVPVLEEAFYQQAKCKDDYRNMQLLESRLKSVLCHFEAGNGPFLVQGMTPLYPVKTRWYFPPGVDRDDDPMDQDHNAHSDSSDGSEIQDITIDEPFGWERMNIASTGSVSRSFHSSAAAIPSQRTQPKSVNRTELVRTGMLIEGGYPRRKIVKRLINMLSNKRKEEQMLLRRELTRANTSAERIAKLLSRAELKMAASRSHGGGVETLESSQSDNNVTISWNRGGLTRTRSDGRLMIGMTPRQTPLITNNTESENEGSAPVEGSSSECPATETTSSVKDEYISASHLGPTQCQSPETIPRSKSSEENSSSAPFSRTRLIPKASTGRTTQKEPASSRVKSRSMELDIQSSPESSASAYSGIAETTEVSLQDSRSADTVPAPDSSNPSPSPLSLEEMALPSVTEQCPPVSSEFESSSSQEEQVAPEDNSNSVQQQQQRDPAKEERTANYKAKDEAEASTSTSGGFSSQARTGGIAVRVPLSTFLAQRDDHSVVMVPNTSYEPGPWDTWEEPTEQLDPLCCVCMVGLKGACFIPCGHTFCRKCSRELWKGRGTCPLCNRYIMELLDIY